MPLYIHIIPAMPIKRIDKTIAHSYMRNWLKTHKEKITLFAQSMENLHSLIFCFTIQLPLPSSPSKSPVTKSAK